MIITEVAGVNWVLPNFNDEYGEVAEAHGKMGERYHAHFPNQETWSSKARLGSKQQVQSNWNVKNTGAFDGTPINEIPEEQRSRVSQMFKNSEPIELPIILKDDKGYILIGGNTRLSMAVATGATPMAWVIDETQLGETAGVGKIVKGVNTTVDVGPGQDKKEQAKFFNKEFYEWMNNQPS